MYEERAEECTERTLELCYLHYVTEIQSRFATTEISGRITNWSEERQIVNFPVFLPSDAFVTHVET